MSVRTNDQEAQPVLPKPPSTEEWMDVPRSIQEEWRARAPETGNAMEKLRDQWIREARSREERKRWYAEELANRSGRWPAPEDEARLNPLGPPEGDPRRAWWLSERLREKTFTNEVLVRDRGYQIVYSVSPDLQEEQFLLYFECPNSGKREGFMLRGRSFQQMVQNLIMAMNSSPVRTDERLKIPKDAYARIFEGTNGFKPSSPETKPSASDFERVYDNIIL